MLDGGDHVGVSRRPIRWWNPAALLAIVALVATVVLVGRALDRTDKVNLADLAAVAIAAAVAATAVVAWARRRNTVAGNLADVTRAADVLADLVRRQWQDEARNRLLDDPEPIPVHWQLIADETVMSRPRLITSEAELTLTGRADDVAALAEAFRALTRRRLVIAGGAGMGKTTLAIQLLLQLLSTRAADQARAGEGEVVPVPVLLPVSGWDPGAHPRLQDWLAVRLTADYPALDAPQLGVGAAAALAEGGHILAVLDGLDEIPAPARAQVLAALNASLTARDQLILTSRRTEFTTAVHDAGRPLTAAAVIVPKPVTAQVAADYLTACLPAAPSEAWTHTLAVLRSRTALGLTRLAATPLGLWLIRTVYIAPGADPIPLTGPLGADADALRTHLLDHVIPALIQTRPPSTDPADHFRPRRSHSPARARHYLTELARLFPPDQTRDITWWHLARTTIAPRSLQAIAGLAIGLVFALMITPGVWENVDLKAWLLLWLGGALAAGLGASRWAAESPGHADLRLRGRMIGLLRSTKDNFVSGVMFGFVFGLALLLAPGVVSRLIKEFTFRSKHDLWTGLLIELEPGLMSGLVFGLVGGLVAGLIAWAQQPSVITAGTPQSTLKADRAVTLLRVSVFGLAAGLALWFAGSLAAGLTVGLAIGLVFGLASGNHHAWFVFVIAVARLASAGRLPWRLMAFLDDAHRLGLLRTMGPIYQFRHAALHDHLATRHRESNKKFNTRT